MRCRFVSIRKFFRDGSPAERGAVSIEMALVTLILSGVLFGIVEIARYGLLRYQLDRATYYAARYLALNPDETETARAMVGAELEQNVGGSVDNVQLYVKSARRDGQCLLVVETQAQYHSTELSWLIANPIAESSQVWPQAEDCGQLAAQSLPVMPTLTPSPTLIVTQVPSVLLDQIEGVAMVDANLRLGPGFEYAIVGRLSEKEAVRVRGRDTTATWLQIAPERVGWVYAPLIQIDQPVSSLQVLVAPPLPSSTPLPPLRLVFDATPQVLQVGECARLRWDAGAALFVTLNEQNVSVQGEQKVCPTTNMKYVLSAGYASDQYFDREANITVYPASDMR